MHPRCELSSVTARAWQLDCQTAPSLPPPRPCSAALKATCRAAWEAFCSEPSAWHPTLDGEISRENAPSLLAFLRRRQPRLEWLCERAIISVARQGGQEALEQVLLPCMAGEWALTGWLGDPVWWGWGMVWAAR